MDSLKIVLCKQEHMINSVLRNEQHFAEANMHIRESSWELTSYCTIALHGRQYISIPNTIKDYPPPTQTIASP